MKIKLTLLASLFMLLVGLQTAQAQPRRTTPKYEFVVLGVHGTITVAVPLSQNLSELKCSDIGVYISQKKPSQGGLDIPIYEDVASTKATGNISKGKCGYIIPNSSGLPVKTYRISLRTSKGAPNCAYIDVDAGDKSVTFPTGYDVTTVDFSLEPSCVQIK